METTIHKNKYIRLSDKKRELIFDLIAFAFIILFTYTAGSKLMIVKDFSNVLSMSPLIGDYSKFISYAIPIVEIVISILLIIQSTKRVGLLLSLALMLVFTIYLIYMISLGGKLPCHCGGVITKLTWNQHIIFNSFFIVLALFGLIIHKK